LDQINNLHKQILENDLNPFMVFDTNGGLKDFNKEAEFLFSYVLPKELFDLAIANASKSYGTQKKFIPLSYDKLKFYAILVNYLDDEYIALKLYKEVCNEEQIVYDDKQLEYVNIFSLIELSKTTNLLQYDIKLSEDYDISIPEIKLYVNDLLISLNDIFLLLTKNKKLNIKVFIKIGEYEIIEQKKHQIIAIEFIANNIQPLTTEILKRARNIYANIYIKDDKLTLDFPMIL